MEENIAYDEGPVRDTVNEGPRRRKGKDEELSIPDEVKEGTILAHRISTVDTMAGMYALLMLSLGIAFPVSEYTSPSGDLQRRDALDTGFELYVFVLSFIFQAYIGTKTRVFLYKLKSKGIDEYVQNENRRSNDPSVRKGDVYVVPDDTGSETLDKGRNITSVNKDVPWYKWHKMAPPVYHAKKGFNSFTRIGILLFGASAVAVEICRLVDIGNESGTVCRNNAKIALIVIRMLFIMTQSLFLFVHHRIIFNFNHPLLKFALLHMIGANLINWIKTVARDSFEVYALVEEHQDPHSRSGHNDSMYHQEPTMAERLCVSTRSAEYRASRYLAPLVIGYCVLAAAILYKKYTVVGPNIFLNPEEPDIWDQQPEKRRENWWRINIGFAIGLPLFLVTCGITVWNMVLSDRYTKDESLVMTQGRISTACNLTWNILIILALFPAFHSVNKLRYQAKNTEIVERIMLAMLGGTFVFLGFTTVASFMMLHDPHMGIMAKMGIPGCLINFLQSVAMFVFSVDAYRRKLLDVRKPHGEGAVTFLIFANVSMWLVTSFHWKYTFGSVLFFRKFGTLPWVLIVNSTLPLAMFYRFTICIILMDVIRDTYGHRGGKCKCVDFHE